MQAILNIELDAKVNGADVPARFNNVMSRVRTFFTRAIGEIQVAEYEGPDGAVGESTAVITFEFHAQKRPVLDIVYRLANDFNQDCIAILFDDGEGRLVGPEADRWGGFNLEYFKGPSILNLFKEAA
jgi:hypothetical protein